MFPADINVKLQTKDTTYSGQRKNINMLFLAGFPAYHCYVSHQESDLTQCMANKSNKSNPFKSCSPKKN